MDDNENILETSSAIAKILALVSLLAIALGGFNDTTDALQKIYDFSLSKFTDIPAQSKLDKIYIRGSADILEENFGAPVYIKHSHQGDVIKYYRDERFILSAITQDGAISAYLVFPDKDFQVDTSQSAGGDDLLTTPFSQQDAVNDIRATLSQMIAYYVEENPQGEFSNLYASISGYSEFNDVLPADKRAALSQLVDDMMLGDEPATSAEIVRNTFTPNFYGYSSLELGLLEEAILTKSEFRLISP